MDVLVSWPFHVPGRLLFLPYQIMLAVTNTTTINQVMSVYKSRLFSMFSAPAFARKTAVLWLCFLLPWSGLALAKPQVMIIIDDVGYRHSDLATLTLPTQVTLSILPDTPLGATIADRASRQGRDVMLHLPMESENGNKLGPRALTVGMYPHTIADTLSDALRTVPNAMGINNHMGSLLTRERLPMQALMQAVKKEGLFFIDSKTTPDSVAADIARKTGIPTAVRDVFLDHVHTRDFLEQQMSELVDIAKRRGVAIGIAHPHPLSVAFLAEALPELEKQGIALISANDYFSSPASPSSVKPAKRRVILAPQ